MSRGGARKGAGRKPRSVAKKAVTFRLEPKTFEKFTELRYAHGRSESAQFEEMVRRARLPSQNTKQDRGVSR